MSLLPVLRRLAIAGTVAGAGLTAYAAVEARQYTLRRVTVPVLPPGSPWLRVLHLSDVHMTPGQTRKQRWLRDLAGRAAMTIGIDSAESARRAAELLEGSGVAVLVEVDSGQHRTGVQPDDAGRLAAVAAEAGLDVRGVFTFPGHSYAPDGRAGAADDEARALTAAVSSFRDAGLEPDVVSGGSTPSFAHAHTDVVTEQRPGVYLFGDAQQWELGTIGPESIALTCRATVVSHAGGRLVLDAGGKALGADRAPYATLLSADPCALAALTRPIVRPFLARCLSPGSPGPGR